MEYVPSTLNYADDISQTLARANGQPKRNFVQLNIASLSASGSTLSRKLGQLASIGAALERIRCSLSKSKRGSSVGEVHL